MSCDICSFGGSLLKLKIVMIDGYLGISFTCERCKRFRVVPAEDARNEKYIHTENKRAYGHMDGDGKINITYEVPKVVRV